MCILSGHNEIWEESELMSGEKEVECEQSEGVSVLEWRGYGRWKMSEGSG